MTGNQQIKLGVVISYLSIAINIVTGLIYTPWVISSIGRENFGLYTLAMSVMSLFVFDFGLSASVTRFIAKYLAKGEQNKADNCVGLAFRLYLVIDIFIFLVLSSVYFIIPNIYKQFTLAEISKFETIYVVAALYSLFSFPFIPLNGILNAHEKFVQVKICDVCHKLINVVLMSVCLFWGYGLYALVLVYAVSGIITILLKLVAIVKFTNQRINISFFQKSEFKSIVSYSGWTTIISLSQRCIFSIAPSILGYYSGTIAIAILGIAITIEGYTFVLSNALNGMFLPKVSRLVSNNGEVLPLMIRIGRLQIYIVGFIILCLFLFGKEFISLWVGDGFNQSYLCAILIVIPSFFHLPQMIGNEAIYAKNKVKQLSLVYLLMAFINIGGAILLSSLLGSIGICLSICISYFIRTIGMDYILYNDLKIDIFSFFKASYIDIFPSLIISILCGIIINVLVDSVSWEIIIFKGLIFTIIYFIVIFYLGMNELEKEMIINPLKRLINKL